MSIFLDDRERDLYPHLSRSDVPVTVTRLEFGDCMFSGCGPASTEVTVGVERKKLGDLISSMRDRRLSGHQIRGMQQAYDYRFLITEGVWRPGAGGEIEELVGRDWRPVYNRGVVGDRGAVAYRHLLGYLTGLELRGNVIWRRTAGTSETAAMLTALWHNWQKPWDQHHSHDQLYSNSVLPVKGHGGGWGREHTHDPAHGSVGGRVRCEGYKSAGTGAELNGGPLGRGASDSVARPDAPTTLWRMAAQLPGVDRRAQQVAAHFRTVLDLVLAGLPADEKERVRTWLANHPKDVERAWREVDGVGPVIAKASMKALTEFGT